MITTLAFEEYRSLRDLRFSVGRLTVITGANGTGKSNVYKALRLLVDAAEGQLGRALAREGGMPSALSAIPQTHRTKGPRRLSIGFADEAMAYELRLGLPADNNGGFAHDPLVKEETIRTLKKPKVTLLERRNQTAMLRDDDGHARTFGTTIDLYESVLSQLAEPHRYPVLALLRERLRRWRFYHQIRTDADSPVRQPQVSSRTPVLSHDGHDLAAALKTIMFSGDHEGLANAVAEAFDGAQLRIGGDRAGLTVQLETPGVYRPLDAAELSDGTLRYLALLAALRTLAPPELLVLNEPETSLHPRVLAPLAKQIVEAARESQVIVVSHAAPLVEAVCKAREAVRIELVKQDGATKVKGQRQVDEPPWTWTS